MYKRQIQDPGAVPGGSTINASVPCIDPLNQEARKSRDRTARLRECMCNCRCIYDGGEIGSTDTRRQWRIKNVNANDNFAPEMRLAA